MSREVNRQTSIGREVSGEKIIEREKNQERRIEGEKNRERSFERVVSRTEESYEEVNLETYVVSRQKLSKGNVHLLIEVIQKQTSLVGKGNREIQRAKLALTLTFTFVINETITHSD